MSRLEALRRCDEWLCVRMNAGLRYGAVLYFFRSVSWLGNGIFWYSLMLAFLLQHGVQAAIEKTVGPRRVPGRFEILIRAVPVKKIRITENPPAARRRVAGKFLRNGGSPAPERGERPEQEDETAPFHPQ